jgi:hypothetical protein
MCNLHVTLLSKITMRYFTKHDCLLNCCWPSPAQWFLVPSPMGLTTIFYSQTALGAFRPLRLSLIKAWLKVKVKVCCWTSLHSLGKGLTENTASSNVVSLSAAAEKYLPRRRLATAASSCSTILAASCHITILKFSTNHINESNRNNEAYKPTCTYDIFNGFFKFWNNQIMDWILPM